MNELVNRSSDNFSTFPRSRNKNINVILEANDSATSHFFRKPKKISNVHFSTWTPKTRKVIFENVVNVDSFTPDSQYSNIVSSIHGCKFPAGYLNTLWKIFYV